MAWMAESDLWSRLERVSRVISFEIRTVRWFQTLAEHLVYFLAIFLPAMAFGLPFLVRALVFVF